MPLTDRYEDLDTVLDDYLTWYLENQARVVDVSSCVRFLKLAADGQIFILHHLRDALMALRRTHTNNSDLDAALDTYTSWYASNSDTITDVMPLLQFLKKAQDDSLHLLHMMRSELREAQNKTVEDSLLWLPLQYR